VRRETDTGTRTPAGAFLYQISTRWTKRMEAWPMDIQPGGRSGDRDDGRGGKKENREHSENRTTWDEEFDLDEEFIRGAEVREPAARTRMLRERWRESPPEPQPWRADAPPAGWFFSKSRRRARKRRRGDDDED
jgi:hypothetical protein